MNQLAHPNLTQISSPTGGRATVPVVTAPGAAVKTSTTDPGGATVNAARLLAAVLVPPASTCRMRTWLAL